MGALLDEAMKEARRRAQRKQRIKANISQYSQYQTDPARFGVEVLGDKFTPDVEAVMRSVYANPVTIAQSANATGKSLPVDTPVLTPDGYVPIGSLSVGNLVIGRDGWPTRVIGVFPQGMQPTYRMTFNDGTDVLCSEDHLWTVRSSSGKHRGAPWQVMTTKELSGVLHRHMHIPMCGPVRFPFQNLPVDPYVLGVLLGDGTLGQSVRFDGPDDWIVREVSRRLSGVADVKLYRKTHYGITTKPGEPNPVLDAMRSLGLIGLSSLEKHIPGIYMMGDVAQRKALLAGIMDTDGSIDRNGYCEFSTSSHALALQVRELANSLGGTAKIATRVPRYTHNGEKRTGAPSYRLSIKMPFCPFWLPRKAERWRDPATMQKQAHRLVKSIEPVGEHESVCIKVDAEDALFLTQHCIVTHNTHSAARVAVWFYKCFPGAQVYTTAAPPEDNLRRLLWGEISNVAVKRPELFADDRKTIMHYERSPVEFMTGVTIPLNAPPDQREARFSGKHAPYLLFIVDEGDAVPPEIYKAIEGCMSGGFARMLIMLNPRHKAGPIWRMTRENKANVVQLNALNHPNVTTGEEVYPGAVTRDVTVRRMQEMSRALSPNEGRDSQCFEVPDFLVGHVAVGKDGRPYPPMPAGWRKVTDNSLWYMTFGLYPPQGDNQLIAEDWVDAAVTRWHAYVAKFGEVPPVNVDAVVGLDVADFGVDNTVMIPRWGGFVGHPYTWGGVDVGVTADKTLDIIKRFPRNSKGLPGVSRICVDANGLGAGVPSLITRNGRLTRRIRTIGVRVTEKPDQKAKIGQEELGDFYMLRDQLWWAMREWLRSDPGAMLPPDEELRQELLAPTYTTNNKRQIVVMSKDDMKQNLGRSPDRAEALMLTFVPANRNFKLDFL